MMVSTNTFAPPRNHCGVYQRSSAPEHSITYCDAPNPISHLSKSEESNTEKWSGPKIDTLFDARNRTHLCSNHASVVPLSLIQCLYATLCDERQNERSLLTNLEQLKVIYACSKCRSLLRRSMKVVQSDDNSVSPKQKVLLHQCLGTDTNSERVNQRVIGELKMLQNSDHPSVNHLIPPEAADSHPRILFNSNRQHGAHLDTHTQFSLSLETSKPPLLFSQMHHNPETCPEYRCSVESNHVDLKLIDSKSKLDRDVINSQSLEIPQPFALLLIADENFTGTWTTDYPHSHAPRRCRNHESKKNIQLDCYKPSTLSDRTRYCSLNMYQSYPLNKTDLTSQRTINRHTTQYLTSVSPLMNVIPPPNHNPFFELAGSDESR